jgi:hypothetical protein
MRNFLTSGNSAAMLSLVAYRGGLGLASRNTTAQSRSVRFFYAQRSALHYVGLGEAVARLAGSVVPVGQPRSVRHHDGLVLSGY